MAVELKTDALNQKGQIMCPVILADSARLVLGNHTFESRLIVGT